MLRVLMVGEVSSEVALRSGSWVKRRGCSMSAVVLPSTNEDGYFKGRCYAGAACASLAGEAIHWCDHPAINPKAHSNSNQKKLVIRADFLIVL